MDTFCDGESADVTGHEITYSTSYHKYGVRSKYVQSTDHIVNI